jgi:hypothetical protein
MGGLGWVADGESGPADQQNPAVGTAMLEIRRDIVANRLDELAAATAALVDTRGAR